MTNLTQSHPRLIKVINEISVHEHLCLIYRTQSEQFAAAIPFMKTGIENGQKCLYIADDNTAHEVTEAMKSHGINTDKAIASGQLTVASVQDAYLKQGYFDPQWMIDFLQDATETSAHEGYPSLRITGEMTWALGDNPGVDKLIEYEVKLNQFFPHHNSLALCQYSFSRFSAEIIRDIIHTHPRVIIGGLVCKNFFYKSPEEHPGPSAAKIEVDRMMQNLYEFERNEIALDEARTRLEDKVRQRTAELEQRNQELKQLNSNMAGREYRIRELEIQKKQLELRLSQLLGH